MDIEKIILQAVDHLAEGVVITDANLEEPGPKIVYVNKVMTQITGYSEEEIIGKTPRVLQGERTDHEARREMKNALKEGLAIETTIENYKKDKTTYWVDLKISPVFDENGNIVYYIAIQKDITKEKELEDHLDVQFQEIRERINKLNVRRK